MRRNMYEVISMVKRGDIYHAVVYRTRFHKQWPYPLRFEVSGRDDEWTAKLWEIKVDRILLHLLKRGQARFEGEPVERKPRMFPWMGR